MKLLSPSILLLLLSYGLVGCSGSSSNNNNSEDDSDKSSDVVINTAPTAVDFSMELNVDDASITADWKKNSSAVDVEGELLSASVITQGSYGTFVITDSSITYLKTAETTGIDTGTIEITDGNKTVSISINVNALYWTEIKAGYYFSVGLKSDGTIWSWGYNKYGQLGNNTEEDSHLPVQEYTASTNWQSISIGDYHVLAINTDGELWAWGRNEDGQLGNNDDNNSSVPVQEVTKNTTWKTISAGYKHSTALKSDNTIWSWGYNNYGQIGNNEASSTDILIPTQENSKSTNWLEVSAGKYHSTALNSEGEIWSWGDNADYQLGDNNSTIDSSIPVQESFANTNWASVSAGRYHTVALNKDGEIWSWGKNDYGQLGNSSNDNSGIPVQESTTGTWSKVVAGEYHSAAFKSDNSLYLWGANDLGQLGVGTSIDSTSPIQESTQSTSWLSISGGYGFAIGLQQDGTYWAWGTNDYGQYGNGSASGSSLTPIQEDSSSTTWQSISAGLNHTVAIKSDNTLWSWGENSDGQLGDGTTTGSSIPVQEITGSTLWSSVSTHYNHTAAIRTDGTLWLWGKNDYGQLADADGSEDDSSIPTQEASASTNWESVSTGAYHTVAIKDGEIWSWGRNNDGQIGDGTDGIAVTATQESTNSTNWAKVSAGGNTTAAINDDGEIWSWGAGDDGQLGDNSFVDSSLNPVQENSRSINWDNLSVARNHTIAINTDGELWSWGDNDNGQLGNNDTADSSVPVQENSASTDWASIASLVSGSSLAIKTDGTLWGWGSNSDGELGLNVNNTTDILVPTQEYTKATNWKNSALGDSHGVAITTDNTIYSFGDNSEYQLGTGFDNLNPEKISTRY